MIYCCYGAYADVGHDADCENAPKPASQPTPPEVIRQALEALEELRYASTDKAEAMADTAIARLRAAIDAQTGGGKP